MSEPLKCKNCIYLDNEKTVLGYKCLNKNRNTYKGKQVYWRLLSSVACVHIKTK